MNALTLARLGITAWLWTVVRHGWRQTAAVLLLVILADVFDGVIARRLGVDGVRRRFLDAAVDRFSIHSVYAFALWTHPQYCGWYWPLLVRDLIVVLGYWCFVKPTRRIIVGSGWHKWSSLSLALLGLLVVAESASAVAIVAPITIGIAYLLLADYLGLVLATRRAQIQMQWDDNGVIRARGLLGIQTLSSYITGRS